MPDSPLDGGPDVFVHFSGVIGSGYKSLHDGQNVTYEVVEGAKGLQAENVKTLD
jgi:cold shock protein